MRRLPTTIAAVLAAALLVACGSGQGTTARVQAWEAQPPYLPPPDPSQFARAGATAPAAARRPSATSRTTTPKPAPGTKVRDLATAPASGAPSDAQVAADLREAFGGKGGANLDQAAIDGSGLAITPSTAPRKLIALIRAANQVARKPYVYGGGHGRNPDEIWEDSAYDCSGSVSYALASAGYIDGPMDSGTLARFGKAGPGKWVSIYANAGHAFMVVAGLRFDTSGRQRTGTRWQSADARSYAGFTVRHPPGL